MTRMACSLVELERGFMSQINEDSKKPTKDRLNPIVFYGSAVTIVLFSLWTIIFTDQVLLL